jgi:Predicted membrane protein (DUF2085)
MRRMAACILLALSLLWVAAIVAAPRIIVSDSGEATGVLRSAAVVVYLAGGAICHQRPERSFHAGDRAYPVCARCTGLYAGVPFGLALILLRRRQTATVVAHMGTSEMARLDRTYAVWRAAVGLAIVPTLASLALEWTTGLTSAVSRALTASPVGVIVGAFVAAALLGHLADSRLLHLRGESRHP